VRRRWARWRSSPSTLCCGPHEPPRCSGD
jgi:hypothetical protein